ncbi:hypothetical protein BC829DRAFT_159525 [Chytridium lagenaria]|nr:hypothetical protein BC829DRAFT_159525 [Chytridium lagenaria]
MDANGSTVYLQYWDEQAYAPVYPPIEIPKSVPSKAHFAGLGQHYVAASVSKPPQKTSMDDELAAFYAETTSEPVKTLDDELAIFYNDLGGNSEEASANVSQNLVKELRPTDDETAHQAIQRDERDAAYHHSVEVSENMLDSRHSDARITVQSNDKDQRKQQIQAVSSKIAKQMERWQGVPKNPKVEYRRWRRPYGECRSFT